MAKQLSILWILVFLLAACSKETSSPILPQDPPSPVQQDEDTLVFSASIEDDNIWSKTEISSNRISVLWSPKEQISVFSNGVGAKYVSNNTTAAKTAEFTKETSSATLTAPAAGTYYYGIYPYSSANAQTSDKLTVTIPSVQQPVVGSFAQGSFVSVARSSNTSMAFYNVCGGICFSLTQDGITKIEFKGGNGENLAGKVKVAFNASGRPEVTDVVAGSQVISLTPSGASTFETGKWYYMSVLPGTLSKGFVMTFYKNSAKGTREETTSQEIKRSVFGNIANIDIGVVFYDNQLKAIWPELPSSPAKSGDYYYTTHITDVNDAKGNKARNYAVCYSKTKWCTMWVAAPYHKFYTGSSGRTDAYKTDPNFDFTQPGKWTGYTRGHLMGSAERTKSKTTNNQVFYYSNIAPQLQTYFNTGGGVWNDCEDWIQGQWESASDTTYVVTGCWWDPFQTSKFVSGTEIPTHYYKIILRTKNHSTKYVCNCSASELQCLAILIPHKTYSKAHAVKPSQYESEGWLMSVRDLEIKTGFTFFPNVPNAPKTTYTLSDWGL